MLLVLSCFYRQAQTILKCEIPSNRKPLIRSPENKRIKKGRLNKYKSRAYYRNFTVFVQKAFLVGLFSEGLISASWFLFDKHQFTVHRQQYKRSNNEK